jgi:peptidoglycan hydrolase-like protein with peptidoglycan-binding domain
VTRRAGAGRVLALGLVLTVAAGSAGWVAADRFQSPAQREAAAEAPEPGAVTVPVVQESLLERASARGSMTRVTGESVPLRGREATTVVTAPAPGAGSEVAGCDVLAELNGRPVLAVVGSFPFYRDLVVGDTGPDVEQLQDAVRGCGFPVRVDGRFGAETERAVRAVYRRAGFPAPEEVDDTVTEVLAEGATGDAPAPQRWRLVVRPHELGVVASLPASVVASPPVGTTVDGATTAVELVSGDLVAHLTVAATALVRIAPGTPVVLRVDDGREAAGVVDVVPDAGDGLEAPVTVRPVDGPFPPDWFGAAVLGLIAIGGDHAESLVVPTSALVPQGHGVPRVLRQAADGSFHAVEVEELAVLGGRSAVRPVADGQLAAGDRVRVG